MIKTPLCNLLVTREDNPFTAIGFLFYLHSKGFKVQNIESPKGLCHLANLNKWILIQEDFKYVSIEGGDDNDVISHLQECQCYSDVISFPDITALQKYLVEHNYIKSRFRS